jgi:transcription antitermination factor NusG
VRRIPGIVAIVSLAGEPVPIPEEQIDAVRRVAYSGLDTELSPYLYTGQSVYVIGGPLEGTRGIYIRSKKDGCLVINVDLLQRSVSVSLHPSLVKPS